MSLLELAQVLERNRRLTELCSLPFFVQDAKESKVVWFNYDLDQTEDEIQISIRNILSTKDQTTVEECKVDILLTAKIQEYSEPEMDETQYYILLEQQSSNCSYDKAIQLISKAVPSPLIIAYQAVIKYLEETNQKREEETIMEEIKREEMTEETVEEVVEEVQEEVSEEPVEAEAEAAPAPMPSNDALLERLEAIQQAIEGLQEVFDSKIATDTHKNGLFDNMHKELTRYQNGALDKIVDTIALDIIQLVDTTKGHVRVYEAKEPNEENYKRLLRIVKGITEDLQDILYRQNIESYRVEGHEVDVRRQKIIQILPTNDQSKDNLVAVRAADGYEKSGKVLRPERIKIFKYSPDADNNSAAN